jgi:hypothetical protein
VDSPRAAAPGAALTRQLLAFSRKQVLKPVVLDLNSVVEEMDKLLRRVMGEHIDLLCVLEPDLANVRADRTQLEQVLVNLAVNARDAMPHGGKITVRTGHRRLTEQDMADHDDLEPGYFVSLSVSDTGTGMDAETRERLFEPFFTTKGQGKGTGLGLATVYGIVKQSGGDIVVDSKPGQGSTFRILLPCVEVPVTQNRHTETNQEVPSGTETVLLVEDEEAVRALASRTLARAGYKVTTVANAEEALHAVEEGPEQFQMLVTDVVLPAMSGDELARSVRESHPSISILFISGFMDNASVREGVLEQGLPFLQKPFTPRRLAERVREVLDAERCA